MTRERTIDLLRMLREAALLLDQRYDARAVDEVRRVITEVRAELTATGQLTALISLAWMFVESLEKRIGS